MDKERRPHSSRAERRRALRRRTLLMLRSNLARNVAQLVQSDPERLRLALQAGLREEWLKDPASEEPLSAPPRELLQRFLETEVERKPSTLAELGLSALQILDSLHDDARAGERAQLAVAFTDLDDFTSYTAEHGDEAAADLIANNIRVVRPIVRARGGHVVKRLGDGFLLSFPSPEAGVLSCLEVVGRVRQPLAMRAGVHWGEPIVMRGDLIGHDVNVAARVTDIADGGEVLVTEQLREAVGELDGVVFDDATMEKLEGLPEPVGVRRASLAAGDRLPSRAPSTRDEDG